jgi:acetylornithine deacetylase/succinyl-diaminopimelate desuccinylase-like protein
LRAALVLLIAAPGWAAEPDWSRVRSELIEHYTALLRIDTSNPPGNETAAAKYLRSVLERERIPSKLLALEPSRANLVARLRGNGSKRPVLIMGHTDVVGVQRERWTVDPFAAVRKDGYIYGRGAVDDKDNLATCLMVMLLLKRQGAKLDRDVIFLAEAGEEGTTRVGIDFLVQQHWDEIEAEYALAEGGGGLSREGRPRYVTISTTEKTPRGIRLIARGTAGHGSRPRLDNAVVRIANAVARIGAWQPPMRLNDTTRTYFERLATVSPPAEAFRYNHISNPAESPAIERYFAEHELGHYSMLRTSISPNIIRAGFRSNVIPSEAEAYLDVRALPDENIEQLVAEVRRVIADPNVEVVPPRGGRPAAPPSRLDTEMFRVLEAAQQQVYPGAITLPVMLTGATDMAQLRARGVQAYGVGPVVDEKDRERGGAHGDDERLGEEPLQKLLEFLWRAVTGIAASD